MRRQRPEGAARRRLLAGGGAPLLWGLGLPLWPTTVRASTALAPLSALDEPLQALVRQWCGGQVPQAGRVQLDVPELVDNGNGVLVGVAVDSPMTAADHVREIVLYTERNPRREVLRCELTPAAGQARVSTRMRLATSQHVVALARLSDGSVWYQAAAVVVALAACLEG